MDPHRFRILLVEDESWSAARIGRHLAVDPAMGFEVTHCGSLAEALWWLQGGDQDLVMLDLTLPDSKGLETIRRTRVHCPHIPIIALADRTDDRIDDEMALKALQCGAQDYLAKEGLNPDLLFRAVRYAIERQRLLAELEQARQQEHYTATHDLLTGLPNRTLFEDRLERALEDARRSGHQVALLFLDLNRFKLANDTLGHNAGDRLIRMVAQRLATCIRSSDSLARMGGDEFTAILTRVKRPQDVTRVAGKFIEALDRPFVVDGYELRLGVSIGASLFPTDGSDAESLVKHADLAMYRAKAQGRSAFEFFRPSMTRQSRERVALEANLRRALDRNEFSLRYQPQVDARTGRVICLEALVRWSHPTLGTLMPSQFMNLAEETGLVVPLGEWTLREACRQSRLWLEAGYPATPVAVNFSLRQFEEPGMDRLVRSILRDLGLPGSLLELELTEGAVMRSFHTTEATLHRLREADVRVVLDNFGSGASSLDQLRKLPLEKLKIGGRFIRSLESDPSDQEIVSAIVGLAHSLRLKPVAEGVETELQARTLRTLNCHRMQGYYFSKPVTASRVARLFEAEDWGKTSLPVPDALRSASAA